MKGLGVFLTCVALVPVPGDAKGGRRVGTGAKSGPGRRGGERGNGTMRVLAGGVTVVCFFVSQRPAVTVAAMPMELSGGMPAGIGHAGSAMCKKCSFGRDFGAGKTSGVVNVSVVGAG